MIKEKISIGKPGESNESYLNNLEQYKELVDRSSTLVLHIHLENAVSREQFELAGYISTLKILRLAGEYQDGDGPTIEKIRIRKTFVRRVWFLLALLSILLTTFLYFYNAEKLHH